MNVLAAARAGLLSASVLCLSLPAHSQRTPPAIPPAAEGIPHESGPVRLDVVVSDKRGKPVANLAQSDFSLLIDKQPASIASFRALGSEALAEVLIVIDDVNVPYTGIAFVRDQLKRLFASNGGVLARPVSLAVVTDTGVRAQPSATTDGKALQDALDSQQIGLRTLPRSAGFYGAAERTSICIGALRQLAARESAKPGRKLMVWLSPGWPLLSGPRIDLSERDQRSIFSSVVQLSTELRLARITLYQANPRGANTSILADSYYESFLKGVTKPGKTDEADLSLQVLATQSGGLVLNGDNDTAGLIQRAISDTFGTYEITFDPPHAEQPTEYHSIEVRVAPPNLTARTRTGFYAQP